MADLRALALERGDLPRAPAWTGWWIGLGALLGLGASLAVAPWPALGAAAFGGDGPATWHLACDILRKGVGSTFGGALGGLTLGQLTLGPFAPRLRRRLRPGPAPRRLGLAALGGGLLAAIALPAALAGGHDPGRLLAVATIAGCGLGALGVSLAAVSDRARGVAAWRRRIDPEASPRRDPDALSPEARQALSARGRAGAPPGGP